MGSYNGSKWIIVLTIYFAVLTMFLTFVGNAFGETIITEINQIKPNFCGNPRQIYESFSNYPIFDTSFSRDEFLDLNLDMGINPEFYNRHLDCDKSIGVVSNDTCSQIQGCIWEEIETDLYTCNGEIDSFYYGIDSQFSLFTNDLVKSNSICTEANIINNETLCNLFSCSWYDEDRLSDLSIDDININVLGVTENVRTIWTTISELFTLRFDMGFDLPIYNYMFNFFVFWLPMLMLILSFVQLIRG